MTGTSSVEICVSDLEQSITWFENVLGFRVIRREGSKFAEVSRDEASILVAADDSLYWESERPRLLPPGQRGSGVEIVLLVENVNAVYGQAQQAKADIVRELADHPWHMRQFWVRHPDGYLIRPAQKILSVEPSTYHRQVSAAFQKDVPHVVDALAEVKQTADRLALQQDYLGAATIYETLVTEIFEESHLYYDEEEELENYYTHDYYDEEPDYPEEEGLEEFVKECIKVLGSYLADERADEDAREKCIEVLLDIYYRDLFESHGFTASASEQLVSYATLLERGTIAENILTSLAKAGVSSARPTHAKFLLDLQKETLDDEAYLQICRENGLTTYLIERLLTIGRVDEAATETQLVSDDNKFLGLADLFVQHKQDTVIESLVRARIKEKPSVRVLQWFQNYYQIRGNITAELEVTETLFRTQPTFKNYLELRDLARQLDRWPTLRPTLLTFLEESQNIRPLIEIALDEGEIDNALQWLKSIAKKDSNGTTYSHGYAGNYGYYGEIDIDLMVAQTVEETRPHVSIEVYQNRAERIIALRDRKSYEVACSYLVKVRSLYEKIGEREAWVGYIVKVRELTRRLPAMKEEMAKAKL